MKGDGNQQDYGMRVYDPRLGRFLSVDPLTTKYPELTPYQFSSNRPIDCIDLDGAEALRSDGSEIMTSDMLGFRYPQGTIYRGEITAQGGGARRNMARTSNWTLGAGAAVVLGVAYAPAVTAYSERLFWSTAIVTTNPTNIQMGLAAAGFTINLLNPDPNSSFDMGGPGGGGGAMLARAAKVLFRRSKFQSVVTYVIEAGAELRPEEQVWANRLLDEGRNVVSLVTSKIPGVRTADYLIDGVKTDLKTISKIVATNADELSDKIRNVIKSGSGQGTDMIVDVTGQAGATLEIMKRAASRYFNKGQSINNIRVVGVGFDEVLKRADFEKVKPN